MSNQNPFSELLKLDAAKAVEKITNAIRAQVTDLKRRGAVIGLSGGIDSSAVTALSANALGTDAGAAAGDKRDLALQ